MAKNDPLADLTAPVVKKSGKPRKAKARAAKKADTAAEPAPKKRGRKPGSKSEKKKLIELAQSYRGNAVLVLFDAAREDIKVCTSMPSGTREELDVVREVLKGGVARVSTRMAEIPKESAFL